MECEVTLHYLEGHSPWKPSPGPLETWNPEENKRTLKIYTMSVVSALHNLTPKGKHACMHPQRPVRPKHSTEQHQWLETHPTKAVCKEL